MGGEAWARISGEQFLNDDGAEDTDSASASVNDSASPKASRTQSNARVPKPRARKDEEMEVLLASGAYEDMDELQEAVELLDRATDSMRRLSTLKDDDMQ